VSAVLCVYVCVTACVQRESKRSADMYASATQDLVRVVCVYDLIEFDCLFAGHKATVCDA
jgi:hypothetical protein